MNKVAKFMWLVARVDDRQYRQNSTELQPDNFIVGVEIPVETRYVWNAEEILKAPLEGNQEPAPIYTPEALRYCLDKLGEYLRDPDDVQKEDLKPEDEDDWGDTSTEPTNVAGVDDGWSDAIDTDDEHKEDEKWDEKEEDWS